MLRKNTLKASGIFKIGLLYHHGRCGYRGHILCVAKPSHVADMRIFASVMHMSGRTHVA